MSNSYFRFKEFTVHQDDCAMKVCTDSCLFGAWMAAWIQDNKLHTQNVLDVGAGTGLLSLMLAQKLPSAIIDAVEIEPLCCKQAENNILQSLWSDRLRLYNTDINQFASHKKYDVIISNPPFYESDLRSRSYEKNIAHHDYGFTLSGFIIIIKKWLAEDGCFAVLLPHHRMPEFEKMAIEEGFFVNKKTFVKQTDRHSYFRVMGLFSKEKGAVLEDEIIIKEPDDLYSNKFIFLLKDYYLHL